MTESALKEEAAADDVVDVLCLKVAAVVGNGDGGDDEKI